MYDVMGALHGTHGQGGSAGNAPVPQGTAG